MPIKKDLTGKKFGRLTVVSKDGKDKFGRLLWNCTCECGKHTIVAGYLLRSGHTKSCGCLRDDKAKENLPKTPKGESAPSYKHGGTGTRLLRIWKGMRQRCYDQNADNYAGYGGRGIFICDEWRNDFVAFRDWALENGYRDDLSIDRIENDGPYAPWNCRWADRKTQRANQRPHKTKETGTMVMCVETGVIYKSIKDAAKDTGAPNTSISAVLHGRLKRAGGFRWIRYEKATE